VPNAPSDVDPTRNSEAVEPAANAPPMPQTARPAERGGPSGPEPTRFGDWERNGRCIDF